MRACFVLNHGAATRIRIYIGIRAIEARAIFENLPAVRGRLETPRPRESLREEREGLFLCDSLGLGVFHSRRRGGGSQSGSKELLGEHFPNHPPCGYESLGKFFGLLAA